jgi:hypothetical protein
MNDKIFTKRLQDKFRESYFVSRSRINKWFNADFPLMTCFKFIELLHTFVILNINAKIPRDTIIGKRLVQ